MNYFPASRVANEMVQKEEKVSRYIITNDIVERARFNLLGSLLPPSPPYFYKKKRRLFRCTPFFRPSPPSLHIFVLKMKSKYTTTAKHNKGYIYRENIPEQFLFFFLIFYLLIVLYVLRNTPYKNIILLYIVPCVLLFKVSFICLPRFIHFLHEKGLYGVDLNKISKGKVAEPIGLFPSILYFIFTLFYQLLYYDDHKILLEYNAGLLSIIFMTFLGFIDDILELKWRYKVVLPFFGINGLEIGQSLIIAFFISIHNLIEIILNLGTGGSKGIIEGAQILKQHFLSIIFILPFVSINLVTFSFNFYPSKGFVGNTLTYFCGIFLAVVSIFGHFSKTLILFLIPQFLNFFLSLPQLLNFVPCPRHRLPVVNPRTNKLTYSHNYTLINLILYLFGPLSEFHLVVLLLAFQFGTCSLGLFFRYFIDTT
ncbi:N-acetylglucosamine-1-phosphate transferase [Plasmodium cynomolgi strain B]|uniref:UDP-N-acetylglucosamine--dolichyl-phosphate N-acetylglucosaminephosphotransferase n=1 Tax=Plasmodium cynomolgi (strain B) TaxID=1120755 RepID=K6UV47_PLACD|nr:N-acetylglucosamine-1-phosphate transferase [Plasmodium cynomolgi strain B]GAB66125.1 N-acetylglucosamine-1-phosphate transferase [Plasmodium cynomolgi strain B]